MPPAEVVQRHVRQRQEEDHEGAHLHGPGTAVQDVQHTGVQGPQGCVQEVGIGGRGGREERLRDRSERHHLFHCLLPCCCY